MAKKSKISLHPKKAAQKFQEDHSSSSDDFYFSFKKGEFPETSLDGFDDILDILDKDEVKEGAKGRSDVNRKSNYGDYSILTFLERELERLRRISTFVSKKLPNMLSFQQNKTILEEERNKLTAIQKKCGVILIKSESPLHKTLAYIWDSSFKQKR